jgi:N-acetylneuraminic acid mutarotase
MPTARHHHTGSVVGDKLFIIGGRETNVRSNVNANEMYDPEHDTWKILEPMPTKRSGLASAAVDNNIFVIGGEKVNGSYNINEEFNMETGKWSSEPPMPTSRLGHDAVTVKNKIYVIGGKTGQAKESVTGVNEIYIPDRER